MMYGFPRITETECDVTYSDEWVRPTDWLEIPTIAIGEQVVYGVFAVYNVTDGNYVAFSAAGAYNVDWGDGSAIQAVATGVTAQHQYDWVDVGNVTSEGWRQALIKITPQVANNITNVNFYKAHSTVGSGKLSQWMDIVMNVPNCTSFNIGLNNITVRHTSLERVWVKEIGAITTLISCFYYCYSLQSVPLFNTSSVTNFSSMFVNCRSLQSVPLFDMTSANNISTMFYDCSSLQTVPLFDTSIVSNVSSMFYNCVSLQSVPLFDTSAVTNFSNMFVSCFTLQNIPLFDTSAATNVASMFNTALPLYEFSGNLSAVTSATTNMFLSCASLQKVTATGLTRGLSVVSCQMSATELDNFFTSLGTASGAQTITVTGNHGAATCNTAIATGKGFTVVT